MLAAAAIEALVKSGRVEPSSEEAEVLTTVGALLVGEAIGHLRAISKAEIKIKVLK